MFCGPSGTGKTLMVNALAAHLEKRVLLVAWSHTAVASRSVAERCS